MRKMKKVTKKKHSSSNLVLAVSSSIIVSFLFIVIWYPFYKYYTRPDSYDTYLTSLKSYLFYSGIFYSLLIIFTLVVFRILLFKDYKALKKELVSGMLRLCIVGIVMTLILVCIWPWPFSHHDHGPPSDIDATIYMTADDNYIIIIESAPGGIKPPWAMLMIISTPSGDVIFSKTLDLCIPGIQSENLTESNVTFYDTYRRGEFDENDVIVIVSKQNQGLAESGGRVVFNHDAYGVLFEDVFP